MNEIILPIGIESLIITQVTMMHLGAPLATPLLLDRSQIARAAEEMIAEYGSEALTKADERTNAYKSEGFDSMAKSWELICEVIKDLQETDDPIDG